MNAPTAGSRTSLRNRGCVAWRRLSPEPDRLQEFLTGYMAFWHGAFVGEETFGAMRCPVLFVAGDEDDHAPNETATFRRTKLPHFTE